MYTQWQKKRENLLRRNWLQIKHVKFKKCLLHVKLTVYYAVSLSRNIYFLNSTYFIFNQFKNNEFFCDAFAAGCIIKAISKKYFEWWTDKRWFKPIETGDTNLAYS